VTVTKREIRGVKCFVIDIRFRGANGPERYRRAAKDQRSQRHADAEEREIHAYFREHGTIKPLLNPEAVPSGKTRRDHTWDEAVAHYEAHEMLALSESTRRTFRAILKHPVFVKAWGGKRLSEIGYSSIQVYEATLAKTRKPATIHQHRSVLQAVLKSVAPHGNEPGLMLDGVPTFPKKHKIGKQGYELPSDPQVETLFGEVATPGSYLRAPSLRRTHLAFALAAYAGLRASEVRALLRMDVDLDRKVLTVRRSEHHGQVEAPKNGDERVIPIAHPRLRRMLEARIKEMAGKGGDAHVAIQRNDKPWGQSGLKLAYVRTCKRLGLPLSKYHGLRHYYCTALIRRGVPLTTVRYLMGHSSLVVTQRYAHALEAEGRQEEVERAFADVLDDEEGDES
jgi:integrase